MNYQVRIDFVWVHSETTMLQPLYSDFMEHNRIKDIYRSFSLHTDYKGCGKEKKWRGVQEKFSGREGGIYKIFESSEMQNLIFLSDDLFLIKNTDFCWEIAKIFESWEGGADPSHSVVAASRLTITVCSN